MDNQNYGTGCLLDNYKKSLFQILVEDMLEEPKDILIPRVLITEGLGRHRSHQIFTLVDVSAVAIA